MATDYDEVPMWRRIIVVAIPLVLIGLIAWGLLQPSRSKSAKPSPTVSSATTNRTISDEESNLIDAVYRFEEAYSLPTSSSRNEKLQQLTTPEGYHFVYRDPASASQAEKNSGVTKIEVQPGSESIVQAEPFDKRWSAASVYSKVTVRIYRDNSSVLTTLPPSITSWVRESSGWKLAYIQFSSEAK